MARRHSGTQPGICSNLAVPPMVGRDRVHGDCRGTSVLLGPQRATEIPAYAARSGDCRRWLDWTVLLVGNLLSRFRELQCDVWNSRGRDCVFGVVVLEQLHHANRSRNQCEAASAIREGEPAPEGSAACRDPEITKANRRGGINSPGNDDNAATLDFIMMRFMDKRTASVLTTILGGLHLCPVTPQSSLRRCSRHIGRCAGVYTNHWSAGRRDRDSRRRIPCQLHAPDCARDVSWRVAFDSGLFQLAQDRGQQT